MTTDISVLSDEYSNFTLISDNVFKSTRKNDGKVVTIKKIGKDTTHTMLETIGMLPKEYVIMKRLDHPNVAKAYDYKEDDEYFYVIMEYYDGKDISNYLPDDVLTKEMILSIARQLIKAVKYCHDNNVLHRDIKIDNILILKIKFY